MADYNSALPVRTEGDADDLVQVKIVDPTTPSQITEVDTDNNLHVEIHGDNPAGGDETLRLSELGNVNSDGDYDGTNNTKPSSTGIIAHDRGGTIDETSQNVRITGGAGEGNSNCLDVALHDEAGQYYDSANPLPVTEVGSAGTPIIDYNTTASVAKDASSNHDYSIASGNVFTLKGIHISGSGKLKVEVQEGDGAVSESFTTIGVYFNSTANPNIDVDYHNAGYEITGTANTTTVRIVITNLDNQAQDLYSTLIGSEV